ncbi:7TM-DISM domain-containing protein [Desulfovibrio sp. 86]|uniref:ATP-binding region ATPase domain protein n=1 Tax=uncultured Desulfovibrio sp. TaxID=167968 RepID=A0A212L666_9BACT|nr:7TM-DISM domain-containing protein [Desulfovibrio sp. 86]SCM72839.1 ATP-binding region ATPase domain protein [uncultured Desulfovibrio sp.]VZH33775.1 ATP-binding region ATPase domain protein [Desulfovibrio sp. 86]
MTHTPTGLHSGKNLADARQSRRGHGAAARFCATFLCLIVLAALPGALRAAPTEALLSPPPVSAQKVMVPPLLLTPNAPLLPKLQYFIDQTGTMDVEEVASPANASAFQPLQMKNLPRAVGIMWLRFTLAPLPQGAKAGAMLLDMGSSVPEGPVLYEPHANPLTDSVEWREIVPTQRAVLLLPEATSEPLTCYIRLDGLPGLWFEPMLRTPQDAANNWGSLSGTAAILALAVVMLLCLLRGLSEKGQWRVWTALYVAAALAQAVMGMPAYGSGRITMMEAAAVLSPGVALMLLPHVGRHLLRAKQRSRLLDAQFVLLSLPGAALALLPLLPGFGWIIRYLALWPMCTLIFVPSAIGGAIMGLGGARRFLLGCLLPPLFVTAGVMGLDSGYAANLMASAPLWGTALSALIIAGTGAPRDMAQSGANERGRKKGKKDGSLPGPDGFGGLGGLGGPAMPDFSPDFSGNGAALMMEDGAINLDQPLDDPNLRLLPPTNPTGGNAWNRSPENAPLRAPQGAETSAETSWDGAATARQQSGASATNGGSGFGGADPCLWENALRAPLDRLMREGAALGNCALPPAVRQHAENMLKAASDLAHVIDNPGKTLEQSLIGETRSSFNLQHLVREAHDAVSATAENAGIGLAWYMPPQLGHMYEGQAQALRETLCMLLESAVRATSRGAVHLSARRVPESADPGHLLFTVTDTGTGLPPRNRSTLAVTRAWELAGTNNCYLNVECGPQGTTISFTLRLKPLEHEAAAPEARQAHVAIVADRAVERQDLAHMTEALGLQSTEARTMREALELNRETPALLLVVYSPMDGPAQADVLERFKNQALEAGLPFFKALAITADDSRWDALAESGYTHALLEPVERAAFALTVRELFEEAGFALPDNAAGGAAEAAPEGDASATETPDAGSHAAPVHAAYDDAGDAPDGDAFRPEASSSILPDLFGEATQWKTASGEASRLPDFSALPQLMDMTDQMRESGQPVAPENEIALPESEDATAEAVIAEPENESDDEDANAPQTAMVADAGVLLPDMAPLPEQPEDPDDPDIPDLSNIDSLQLPLTGISDRTQADGAGNGSENISDNTGADLDVALDDDLDVDTGVGMGPDQDAEADAALDAEMNAGPDSEPTAEADAEPYAEPQPTHSSETEEPAGDSSPDQVNDADFRAAAGLEGPQWDGDATVAGEHHATRSVAVNPLSGPEQAMPDESDAARAQQPSDALADETVLVDKTDSTEQPREVTTEAALAEAVQDVSIRDVSAQGEPAQSESAQSESAQDTSVQSESAQGEAAHGESAPAEPVRDVFALAEPVQAESTSTAPQTVPQTQATAPTGPAASLAAAISNSASNAGQPVITVQGKIGEAILRPVNAPFPPAATPLHQPGSEHPTVAQGQTPPQDRTNAGSPQSASPEEYLDRNLPASGAALHENLSWGDEWVGEPTPVGTPLSAGARAANTAAGPSAAASPKANEAATPRGYVSPSLSGPGEWVGEPMPMAPKPAAAIDGVEQAATPTPAMRLKTFGGTATGASAQMPEPAAPAAKPLGTIPWPKPGLSETERKSAATGTAEPPQPAQKTREMPRTATGRLILKLLGNVASTEPAARPAPPTANTGGTSAAAAQRPAASRLAGSDAEPSIVDFIAGAAAPAPAEQTTATKDDAITPARSAAPTAAPAPSRAAAQPRVDATLLQMLRRLDAAMEDAQRAFKGRNCPAVGEAATRIANDSDAFGLRVLARMASCVERAANANDMNALHDLLPELAVAVERNRITLNPHNQGQM